MTEASDGRTETAERAANGRPLSDAARRALAEAQARREAAATSVAQDAPLPREIDGRRGPEPVRYGDWEKNGLICDF